MGLLREVRKPVSGKSYRLWQKAKEVCIILPMWKIDAVAGVAQNGGGAKEKYPPPVFFCIFQYFNSKKRIKATMEIIHGTNFQQWSKLS